MQTPGGEIAWMAGLVAAQHLFYGVSWALASRVPGTPGTAARQWAAALLLIGAGFWMLAHRVEPRTFWPYGGGNLLFMSGYTLLRRGMQAFNGQRTTDAEHLLWLGVAAAGFAAAGPQADTAAVRVILAYGLGAVVLARLLHETWRPLTHEFGPMVYAWSTFPAWLLLALFIARGVGQAVDPSQSYEIHAATLGNRQLVFGYLAVSALFNFSFAGLVVWRLVARLQDQARRDQLTGLPNRRALEDDLLREWGRLQRGGGGFAVLALDLDHFKRINDEHGHLVGDEVLAQTAQRMKAVMRGSDVVARVGGEEFTALVSEGHVEAAMAAAERLRQAVAAVPMQLPGGPLAVTVSVGVAVADAQDVSLRRLLQRADRALYRAKSEGRNRAVLDQVADR